MKTREELFEELCRARYYYKDDNFLLNLVDDFTELLDKNYIVNKNKLANFLTVVKVPTTDFGESVTRFDATVVSSAVCRNKEKIPEDYVKDYVCKQFGYQLEKLETSDKPRFIKKSDLNSEEKKMIKYLKSKFSFKNLEDLKEWYEEYDFKERCAMNEALDRYYNGR